MSELVLFILLAVVAVFVSSLSQMMLKISAGRMYPTKIKEYVNPLVIGAYVLFLGASLVMVGAYRVIPLSLGPVVEALGYVFIALMGFCILKEKITRRKTLGMLLIVLGVIICSIS